MEPSRSREHNQSRQSEGDHSEAKRKRAVEREGVASGRRRWPLVEKLSVLLSSFCQKWFLKPLSFGLTVEKLESDNNSCIAVFPSNRLTT
ncbi:hypothetical protein F2Q68_00013029 [Brassica cretica]|uniref:Uncharacterized protein n=1 Tax=Brassica cretica TaxID=69181 RepID=A0A8S9HDD7_BRACR|nr:hypothetical protein F2Q68_00013029 [Brassica cretica]